LRNIFSQTARVLHEEGKTERAVEVLDKMQEVLPPKLFPLNSSFIHSLNTLSVLEAIDVYAKAGETEKAELLSDALAEETFAVLTFYGRLNYVSEVEIQTNYFLIFQIIEILESFNQEKANNYEHRLQEWVQSWQ
jgi:hypothetical protein